MLEYVTEFIELACFTNDYVATDMAKVRKLPQTILKEKAELCDLTERLHELEIQNLRKVKSSTLLYEP